MGNFLKKINVLFIVNGFAIGGGELKVLDLVKGLNQWHKNEFRTVVCSVGQSGPLYQRFVDLGVKTVVFEKKRAFDFSLIGKVARVIREEKVDIVHTTLFYADVIGAVAARIAGVNKIISWEAVTEPYGLKHLLAYRIASELYTKSVAVSEAIEMKVRREYKVPSKKTMTIHYGVDLEKFTPSDGSGLRKELGINKGDVVFGTVARFTEQKGHRYLIEAAKKVVKSNGSAHFVLVGDGPLREEIEIMIKDMGVEKHFHLLGFRTDVDRLLNSFDVFVLPSLYEGLPNAVLEAMAAGLPVIATAVDGTPEAVLHRETGLLVKSKDSEVLADSILTLCNNEKMRKEFGEKGRLRVEEHFSWQGEVTKFASLYKEIL